MQTTWHGVVNPPRSKEVREWDYSAQNISLPKGEEMGRFLLGSTVVMLFQAQSMQFNSRWTPAGKVELGEVMGGKLADLGMSMSQRHSAPAVTISSKDRSLHQLLMPFFVQLLFYSYLPYLTYAASRFFWFRSGTLHFSLFALCTIFLFALRFKITDNLNTNYSI